MIIYNMKNGNISFEYPKKSVLESSNPPKNPSIIPVTCNPKYPLGLVGHHSLDLYV